MGQDAWARTVAHPVGVLLAAVLFCRGALAEGPQPADGVPKKDQRASTPSRFPPDTDPMVVARYVDRVGDRPILKLLAPASSAIEHYYGALAARWLWAPERAMDALLALMGSTDPDVAPVAARAMLVIAQGMDGDALRERGADGRALRKIMGQLRQLADEPRLRADVQLLAGAAAAAMAIWLPSPG